MKLVILLIASVLAVPLALGLDGTTAAPDPAVFAYHVRIVRVSGGDTTPGAGIRCTTCGTPIVLPEDEPWGTPEQLAALSSVLGGQRSEPVTGYLLRPGRDGRVEFAGTLYPGETAVTLAFSASVPAEPGRPHDLRLELRGERAGEPLARAHVIARTERTVSIAVPSPMVGEWIVLSVTPMDEAAAASQARAGEAFVPGGEIGEPRLIQRVEPVYPEAARRQHREGQVVLQTIIDEEGVPRAIRVVRTAAGCEDMAAAATDTLRQWRYEPARKAGVPVRVLFTVYVTFRLS